MNPIAMGIKATIKIPNKNLFPLFSHKNATIAETAKSAPRDWVPKTAIKLSPIAPSIANFSHLDETWERRKYISGITMTIATAIELLSEMKVLPGGP